MLAYQVPSIILKLSDTGLFSLLFMRKTVIPMLVDEETALKKCMSIQIGSFRTVTEM